MQNNNLSKRAPARAGLAEMNKKCAAAHGEPGQSLLAHIGRECGSVTLEGAIIIPVVMLTVCLSIYFMIILYEQAQIQAAASYSAQRVSSLWRGGLEGIVASMDALAGCGIPAAVKTPAGGAGLYHRTIDLSQNAKRDIATVLAAKRSDVLSLPGYTLKRGGSQYGNGVFGKALAIVFEGRTTISNRYVMQIFRLGGSFIKTHAAISLMPDFAEDIRRIDYVAEIEKNAGEDSPESTGAAGVFSDIIRKIHECIGRMM